ncbi:CLUMA_CG019352, isoform A [Clunio marinus]|uniref:CLUMA_CG019352, isoform A n=1 Tax=Clunio marinus TaxID=568069 RepID=A0A1J1J171_9DIPT|nr:CLUMA_CG019352, isoform A [Clunio marinus]
MDVAVEFGDWLVNNTKSYSIWQFPFVDIKNELKIEISAKMNISLFDEMFPLCANTFHPRSSQRHLKTTHNNKVEGKANKTATL